MLVYGFLLGSELHNSFLERHAGTHHFSTGVSDGSWHCGYLWFYLIQGTSAWLWCNYQVLLDSSVYMFWIHLSWVHLAYNANILRILHFTDLLCRSIMFFIFVLSRFKNVRNSCNSDKTLALFNNTLNHGSYPLLGFDRCPYTVDDSRPTREVRSMNHLSDFFFFEFC